MARRADSQGRNADQLAYRLLDYAEVVLQPRLTRRFSKYSFDELVLLLKLTDGFEGKEAEPFVVAAPTKAAEASPGSTSRRSTLPPTRWTGCKLGMLSVSSARHDEILDQIDSVRAPRMTPRLDLKALHISAHRARRHGKPVTWTGDTDCPICCSHAAHRTTRRPSDVRAMESALGAPHRAESSVPSKCNSCTLGGVPTPDEPFGG
jgi:hypothetical protein